MNLIELSKYLQDEQAAEDYLYEKEILKRFTVCPHCGSDKLGHISRGRIKCYKCKKEWHKRKNSILEGRHISSSVFIGIIKLYSDGIGVTKIGTELKLDKKTILEIVPLLRTYIIDQVVLDQLKEVSEFNIILDSSNKINVQFPTINERTEEDKIAAVVKIKKIRLPDKSFSFEINLVWNDIGMAVEWNTIHRFASYVNSRLINYRGLSARSSSEYLLELIKRFNIGEKVFFDFLVERMNKWSGG
jgi:transposase-like protein